MPDDHDVVSSRVAQTESKTKTIANATRRAPGVKSDSRTEWSVHRVVRSIEERKGSVER